MIKAEEECRQMWLAYVVPAPVGSDVWHLQGQWDTGEEGEGMVMRMVLFVSGLKGWGWMSIGAIGLKLTKKKSF